MCAAQLAQRLQVFYRERNTVIMEGKKRVRPTWGQVRELEARVIQLESELNELQTKLLEQSRAYYNIVEQRDLLETKMEMLLSRKLWARILNKPV